MNLKLQWLGRKKLNFIPENTYILKSIHLPCAVHDSNIKEFQSEISGNSPPNFKKFISQLT